MSLALREAEHNDQRQSLLVLQPQALHLVKWVKGERRVRINWIVLKKETVEGRTDQEAKDVSVLLYRLARRFPGSMSRLCVHPHH